jgi:outer membrane receptor protein involved in Fe transport
MRFFAGSLFSLLLSGIFFSDLYAQVSPTVVTGKILTESGAPADGSTVVLLRYKDSSLVNSTAAEKNGAFRFTGVQAGSYLLLLSKAGFNKFYAGPFEIPVTGAYTIPDIILKTTVRQLNEVSVTGTRPEIEAQPGKLVLNVQNSILAQGNSAFDILKQSPGVRVDNGNNISIIGRQAALITIDDKPTNLSGEDLITVLRGIQANMIDHIELITAGSARYDASSGGIINIVLKKGKNIGFNATATGSAGYGRYYKSNAGIVFNDRTDNFNVFGGYNFIDNKNFHTVNTTRDIFFDDILSDYQTNYESIQHNQVNNFNLGTDFYLSKTQTIGFLVNGSITNDSYTKTNNLNIYNQSVYDSTIVANSNLNRHISRVNYNINYRGKLDSAGKTLSADVNYVTYDRSSAEYITNNFFNADGTQYRDPLMLQDLTPSNISVWISKIDFSDPLSKTAKFEAGLKFSDAVSNNDLIFGPLVNGQYTADPNYSDHFKYNENVNAAYADYQNQYNKINLSAGLRAEQTIATGTSVNSGQVVNSNYLDLFPQFLITYKYTDKAELSLSYNRGITRPGYEEINPFLYYIDLYDYRAGNPNLKPEYSNNIELTYDYNKSFTATLYSEIITQSYQFRYFEQNDTSKVNINTPKNFGDIYNYGIRFLVPATFTRWWTADFKADIAYQRYVAYPQNGYLNKGTQDVILTTTQRFTITPTLAAEIFGNYESPAFYGISEFKANYYVDAGISQQLFDKRGTIRISASDIFNTKRDRYSTDYENLNMYTVDKVESQVVRLTFTYRFGKTSVKSTAHRPGNEEEQKRLNSTNEN